MHFQVSVADLVHGPCPLHVGQSERKKEDLQVPSPTMQFRKFGDHLAHQTTSYTGIDVVGHEANKTGKKVKSFPFKVQQSSRGTMVLGPQTGVVVALKGPSIYFHFGRH